MTSKERQKLNEVAEGPSVGMSDKKALLTERLRQRNEERLSNLEDKKSQKETVQKETVEYFLEQFNLQRLQIQDDLDKCNEDKRADFDNMYIGVQSLQKLLTDSTTFLPSYTQQTSQAAISQLKATIDSKRASVAPVKKFAFKGGKKKVATDIIDGSLKQQSQPSKLSQSFTVKAPLNECGFKNRQDETLSISAEEMNQKQITLSSLTNCVVKLFGVGSALIADNLIDCIIYCGPVAGSVFVDKCLRCEVRVACHQLRVHHTHDTTFYLHVTSRAIIEDSDGILAAPYSLVYKGIDEHFVAAKLDQCRNSWNDFDDFNWLASNKPSPHWSVISEEKRKKAEF